MRSEIRLPAVSRLPIGFDRRVDVPASLVAPVASPAQAEASRLAGRAVRVRNAQDAAMDAPFTAAAKLRFQGADTPAHASAASGRGRGGALFLVTNETSGTRKVRESLRVDTGAQRIKRMRISVGHAARLLHFDAHCERDVQRWNKKFITLTYRDVDGWEPGHISEFRDALRQWCKRRGVRARYVWVSEPQTRGALHYHMVLWVPKGVFLPRRRMASWWPHGRTQTVTAQSPIGYITKYASKMTAAGLGAYPKGVRMCGHGGLPAEGRRHIRYWQSPFWVRDALTGRADIRKVPGGYCDKFTGEFLASPWRVTVTPGGEVWAYRIDQPETIQ